MLIFFYKKLNNAANFHKFKNPPQRLCKLYSCSELTRFLYHDLRVQTFVSVADVVIVKLFRNEAEGFSMAAAAGYRMIHHLFNTV